MLSFYLKGDSLVWIWLHKTVRLKKQNIGLRITSLRAVIVLSLLRIAFITLLERKILSFSQIRVGPSKLGLWGVIQPLVDGVKLLTKQQISSLLLAPRAIVSPAILFILFLRLLEFVISWKGLAPFLKANSLFLFAVLSLRTYLVVLTGWRLRLFAKLGRLRGILQTLSYEVALILILIVPLSALRRLAIQSEGIRVEMISIWLVAWFRVSLIERNRAPFDLLEGERELIRGFNLEIGSTRFVYLFLREYGMILIRGLISSLIIFGKTETRLPILFVFLILWIRRCFPRFRYDVLIRFIWVRVLPPVLLIFFICFVTK